MDTFTTQHPLNAIQTVILQTVSAVVVIQIHVIFALMENHGIGVQMYVRVFHNIRIVNHMSIIAINAKMDI